MRVSELSTGLRLHQLRPRLHEVQSAKHLRGRRCRRVEQLGGCLRAMGRSSAVLSAPTSLRAVEMRPTSTTEGEGVGQSSRLQSNTWPRHQCR